MPGKLIGVFGGTFDPVHYGHLRTAFELRERLELDEVRLIPAGQPPHRDAPQTPAAHRLAMLDAAVADEPRLVVDRREVERPGPSYTVDTLASLRADFPGAALCLLLGMDAFLGLPSWHRWRELFGYAHIVVAHRPGYEPKFGGDLEAVVRERRARSPAELNGESAGRILIEPVTPLEISSTALRAALADGADPKYLVPESVRRIILETECYAS